MHAFTDNISADLVVTLTLFAALAWIIRRGLLAAREAGWLGAALVFFGVSLVFNAVLRRNGLIYPHPVGKLVGMSLLMTLPLLLALGYGVVALVRTLVARTLCTVQIGTTTLTLVQGNPSTFAADPRCDALLWPTDTNLSLRGGLSQSLRAFGGPALAQEARLLAPLSAGKAVRIGAGSLPAESLVLAALQEQGQLVTNATAKRALDAAFYCARQNHLRRVVLPPFGVQPGKLSSSVSAALTVAAAVRAGKDFDFIAIVVFDRSLVPAFQSEFKTLAQKHAVVSG